MTVKSLRFYAIQLLLLVALSELCLSIGYRVVKGHFVWQQGEAFPLRDWMVRTDDARYVTIRKNYSNDAYHGGSGTWPIHTDGNGFRVTGRDHGQDWTHLVFIGDSVPFGWGIADEDSYPAQVDQGLPAGTGAINAAIPAMSLDQAVQRYVVEIDGRFAVRAVLLQAYDPVSQFTLMGRDWTPDVNWATSFRRPDQLTVSVLWAVLRKLAGRDSALKERLDPDDEQAFGLFRASLLKSLDLLADTVRAAGTPVYLMPPAVPARSFDDLSPARRKAIAVMNDTLRSYARDLPQFHFIDIAAELRTHDDTDIFRDACCHLTPRGGAIVAKHILRRLEEDGLLAR